MNLRRVFVCGVASLGLVGGRIWAADNSPTNVVVATAAVYVPDTSHQNDPLPDGVLAWDNVMKEATVAANAGKADFVYHFTNVSPASVAILDVHAGCACTTAKLPPMPWILPPGTNGQIGFAVNLAGRTGTMFKTARVTTERGAKQLMFKITILPPVLPTQTPADRARALEIATADRQAIFRGDCVTCHVKPGEGKYGKPLYDTICAICHESKNRASMVPDLHHIKADTNLDFWKTWIAHGKPGSLMPAFSNAEGGSLSDMQIISLSQYLLPTFQSQKPVSQ
jgi:mono/diheme cytochrome c family protein